MKRREFIAGVASAAAWPLAAQAQQVRRIGVLMGYSETDPEAQRLLKTFVQNLSQLGWAAEKKNLHVEYRWASGSVGQMQALAQSLVDTKPDVIVSNTTPVTRAVQKATSSIPIVFIIVSDPVGEGFVNTLARPGRNITGFINVEGRMGGKYLAVLKEAVPTIQRAAYIFNPSTAPGGGTFFRDSFIEAARTLNVVPVISPVRSEEEVENAIAAMAREPNGAILGMPDGFIQTQRRRVIAAAARANVPLIGSNNSWVRDGAMLSYGHDSTDLFRRAPSYVDRILKGASPSELPVELPVKFELFVNTKTAKTLGLTIAESFLVRADEVIE